MDDFPGLPEKEEEKEKKGAGFFFWLSNLMSSRAFQLGLFLGLLVVTFRAVQVVFFAPKPAAPPGVPDEKRAESPRPEPPEGAQALTVQGAQGFQGVSGHDGAGGQAKAGTSAGLGAGGSDEAALQALLNKAHKAAETQQRTAYDTLDRPPGGQLAGSSDRQGPGSSDIQSGGARADAGLMGGAVKARTGPAEGPHYIKALTRSWYNKARPKNSSLKFGVMSTLDRLKGMENTMRGVSGRQGESATAWNKKEWDASAHAETGMSARGDDTYSSRIREEIAARPAGGAKPIAADLPSNDGGPINQPELAQQPQPKAQAAQADALQKQLATRRAAYLMDAAAALMPLASYMLLGSAQGMDVYDVLAKRSGLGELSVAGKNAITGTGMVNDGAAAPGSK